MLILESKDKAPKFFIKLGQGVNGFKFGASRDAMRKKLGDNYNTKDTSTMHKDIYSTCQVIYTPSNTFKGIQLFKKCVVLLDGKKLDFSNKEDAIKWLKNKDDKAVESGSSIHSTKLGIKINFSKNIVKSVYIVPNKDADKTKIDKY